jgi:hypothetical protein
MPTSKPRRRRHPKPPAPGIPVLVLPPGRRRRPTKSNAHPADPEFILWRYECGSSIAAIATTERIPVEAVRKLLTASGVTSIRDVNSNYWKHIREQIRTGTQPPDFYTWRAQHRAELHERARQAAKPPQSKTIKLRAPNATQTTATRSTTRNNNPDATPFYHDPKEPPQTPDLSGVTPPLEQ